MNNAFQFYPSTYDVLQSFTTNTRDNFSINLYNPLKDSKYNYFITSTAPSFAFNAPGTEVAFFNSNISREWWFISAMFFNPCSDTLKIPINCFSMETSDLGYLSCIQIKGKEPYNMSEFLIRNYGTVEILVYH